MRGTLGLGTLAQKSEIDDIDQIAAGVKLVAGESFVDSDDNLMTAAAIDDRINSAVSASTYSFTLSDGSNTQPIASGNTLTMTGSTGIDVVVGATDTATLTFDGSELPDMTDAFAGTDEFIVLDGTTSKRKAANEIRLTTFDDTGFSTITIDGTTANGLLTYGGTNNIDTESNLTFDGSTLAVTGAITGSSTLNITGTATLQSYLDFSGTDNRINNTTNDLKIVQYANDKDIIFYNDDGSGGITTYIELDGSTVKTDFKKPISVEDSGFFADSSVLYFGTGNDLRIQHNGSNSFIQQYGTGDLYIDQTIDDKDIILRCDDGSGGTTAYLTLDGSAGTVNIDKEIHLSTHLDMGDGDRIKLGDSDDLQFVHDSNINFIHSTISDRDIYFRVNDGGASVDAIIIDASEVGRVKLPNDNQYLSIGASGDLYFYHDGSNSIIRNATGDLILRNDEADKDIILQTDDGSGGVTPYLTLDGSQGFTVASKNIMFTDDVQALFGNASDMVIKHDGSNNRIQGANGDMYISNYADDKDVILQTDDGSGGVTPYITLDGSATSIEIGKKMQFPASHSADKIVMYSGGNEKIGTEANTLLFTADNYKFKDTAGHDNLFMNNSGNVGIGTTSPDKKLEVSGDIKISGGDYNGLFFENAGGTTNALLYQHTANGALIIKDIVNNTDRVWFGYDGQVGIGINPQEVLDLKSSSGDCRIRLDAPNGSDTEIKFFNAGSAVWTLGHDDGSGAFRLGTTNVDSGVAINVATGGNVGIGTTSPAYKLHLEQAGGVMQQLKATDSAQSYMKFVNSTTGDGQFSDGFLFGLDSDETVAIWNYEATAMRFATSGAEKMRIDSSGRVLIGDTSVHYSGVDLQVGSTSDSQNGIQIQTSTTGYGYVLFGDGTGASAYRGQISYKQGDDFLNFITAGAERLRIVSGGDAHFDQDVIAFSTTPSDIRLKENFTKIENGLDVVSKLEGHTFNWKKGGDRLSAGFKAQEVEKILPHLVDEKKLPLKADDDKEYKILRYEEMIPYLVEAIKEQQDQINELKGIING